MNKVLQAASELETLGTGEGPMTDEENEANANCGEAFEYTPDQDPNCVINAARNARYQQECERARLRAYTDVQGMVSYFRWEANQLPPEERKKRHSAHQMEVIHEFVRLRSLEYAGIERPVDLEDLAFQACRYCERFYAGDPPVDLVARWYRLKHKALWRKEPVFSFRGEVQDTRELFGDD